MEGKSNLRSLIEQTKPFPSLQQEAVVSLLVTVDRVAEVAEAPLGRRGLSAEQYNVLRILRGAGSEGLPTYRVAARMVSRAPNIARLVSKLGEKGLLERGRTARDGRVRTLRITSSGQRLLGELDGPIGESTRRAFAGVSEREIRTLLALFEKIRAPLTAAAPKPRAGGTLNVPKETSKGRNR
jgi:DNA-binding MarR family transcriptional regulator